MVQKSQRLLLEAYAELLAIPRMKHCRLNPRPGRCQLELAAYLSCRGVEAPDRPGLGFITSGHVDGTVHEQ